MAEESGGNGRTSDGAVVEKKKEVLSTEALQALMGQAVAGQELPLQEFVSQMLSPPCSETVWEMALGIGVMHNRLIQCLNRLSRAEKKASGRVDT